MKHHVDYLFVYGTLRPAARHPLQRLLRRHARWIGPGETTGSLYDLGRYPALVPDACAGTVHGDVYRLRHARVLLRHLDRYEACAPRMPQLREYRREPLPVRCRGLRVWAWAYVYNRPVRGLQVLPGGDYLARLRSAQRNARANYKRAQGARRLAGVEENCSGSKVSAGPIG